MEQLFILELLVHNITFSDKNAPLKKDIFIKATCADFIDLSIQSLDVDTSSRDGSKVDNAMFDSQEISMNCGKSLVFITTPTALLEKMRKNGLDLSINSVNNNVLDTVVIPWNEYFMEMVESIDVASYGFVSPAYTHEDFMTVKNNVINLFIRLSFSGASVNMHIQVIDVNVKAGETADSRGKQYLFKGKNTATTFRCSKLGIGSEEDLQHAFLAEGMGEGEGEDFATNLMELMQFFLEAGTTCGSVYSVAPAISLSKMLAPVNLNARQSTTHSLRDFRPEKVYMDLKPVAGVLPSGSEVSPASDLNRTVTLKETEKMLCNNTDCAGVQSFKKHGVGLLSKYQFDYVPEYYLSHANGRIDCYGPQSRFRRPRRPDEDFMPGPS